MKKLGEQKPTKKLGKSCHEILPSGLTSRKTYQLKQQVQQVTDFNNPYTPFPIFPEWNESEALNFDFFNSNANQSNSFSAFQDKDSDTITLPPSFKEEKHVKWLRPEDYVRELLLEKEIALRLPNKKSKKFRKQLREMHLKDIPYLEKKNSSIINLQLLNQEDGELIAQNNSKVYKEFYNIFERELNLKVVHCLEREEKEEEFINRMRNELALKGEDISKHKNLAKSKTVKVTVKSKLLNCISSAMSSDGLNKKKLKTLSPGSITMKDKYNSFSMWLASIYQSIKDLNITDAYTGETLWQKIYPQENKIPVYNPHGRYWVKLHFMGKLRKVEIDDTMPCAKNDKFLLPKCENLEELWPALLTKALIKLYSHKFLCDQYSEVGDTCYLHSLTGYIAEKVSLTNNSNDKVNEEVSLDLLKKVLTDDNYINKKKFVLCFNSTQQDNIVKLDEDLPPTNLIRRNRRELSVKHQTLKVSRSEHRMKTQVTTNSEMMKIFKEKRNSVEKTRTPDLLPNLNKQVVFKNDSQLENKVVKFKADKLISHYRKLTDLPLDFLVKKSNSDKEVKENKKCNQIYENSLYSIIELFTNNDFNMKRLKILDFSDLKNKMKESKQNYKALGKEEKKVYIHHLIELKNQLKTVKLKRIEDLQQSGGRANFLKVKNKALGAEIEFKETFTDEQFETAKKCILNDWKFPPTSFFESNFISRGRSNDSLADNFSCNSPSPKKTGRKPSDIPEIKTDNRDRYKDIYNQLSGDSTKYNTAQEPLQREEGQWAELTEYTSNFSHFLVLHNPKFYSSVLSLDCNWLNYTTDIYELNSDNTVFKLSHANNTSSKNNKFYNDNSSLLLQFTANNEVNKMFANSNFYIILELIELEFKHERNNVSSIVVENIKLDFNRSTFQFDCLKCDKEYFLNIKGGLFPIGFNLEIFSDHLIENISETMFYKSFLNYTHNTFNLENVNLEKNKMYIMTKLIVNVKNCITNFKFCIKSNKHVENENYLKCFFNLFVVNHSGEKRKLYFSELCEFKPKDEDYYLVVTFTPPYDLKEISYSLEVLTSSSDKNMKIAALEMIEPIEVFDFYKYNRHGLVFKEMIYVPENVCCSLIINIKQLKNKQKENEVPTKKIIDKQVTLSISDLYEEEKLPFNLRMNIEITNQTQEIIHKEDFVNSAGIINLILEGNITKIVENKHKLRTFGKKEENNHIKEVLNTPYYMKCYIDASQEFVKEEFAWTIRVFSSDTVIFVKDTIKEDLELEVKNKWERTQPGRALKAKQARQTFLSQQEIKSPSKEEELTQLKNNNFTPSLPLLVQSDIRQSYKPTNPLIKSFTDYFQNERIIIYDNKLSDDNKIVISDQDIENRKTRLNSDFENFKINHKIEKEVQRQNNQLLRDNLKTSYSTASRNRLDEQEEIRTLLQHRSKMKSKLLESKK